MGSNGTPIPALLVTANVGSIFENPSAMFEKWTSEFLSTVSRLKPQFIALHCQEVGGKNFENSMKHVRRFVETLLTSEELHAFNRVRIFLDEDYSSIANFTALGNFYFIHKNLENVMIYNFKDLKFMPCDGQEIHSNNIETVVTKEKAKFPQNFFPECKWSRKGFLRTRWSINESIFDLINIHLFHDASNLIAMKRFPSIYSDNRRMALEDTLRRFHNDEYETVPFFIFGDFNFRTDTNGVIQKLTEGLTTLQQEDNNDVTKYQFTNEESKLVLTVGKKEFNHSEHQDVFMNCEENWLLAYDKELEQFAEHVFEYPVDFPPSYPFKEDVSLANSYMKTRCPSWCDRVLMSHSAKKLIDGGSPVSYDLMGRNTCMGDHKPVYLYVSLNPVSGIIKCCEHARFECLPRTCPCCRSYAVTIHVTDMSDYMNNRQSYSDVRFDSGLLHEPLTRDMLSHDPYTPESADSRSPLPEKDEPRRRSVSPRQLRRKLESFLKENTKRSNMTRSVSHNTNVNIKEPFRQRTMSELPPKVKASSGHSSLSRLESHHSSSDEEWYEFRVDDVLNDDKIIEITEIKPSTLKKDEHKQRKCCCIS